MKKTILVLLLALSVLGCGKNDDSNNAPGIDVSTAIFGNWLAGQEVLVYSLSGKEVYRKTVAAIPVYSQYSFYYAFKAGAIMQKFEYNTTRATYLQTGGDFTYALSNTNTTLTFTQGSTSSTGQIAFTDTNTMSITSTANGATTYTDASNVSHAADSYTWTYTYTRFTLPNASQVP